MARGFNKVILMGNLARDPEVRYTVDRRAWARFSIAVNYSFKNRNGEYQDSVDFIPVVAWGPLGERVGKYLKKGSAALIEGRITSRSYDAKDGSGKRYVTEVVASDVQFVGSRRDGGEGGAPQYGGGQPRSYQSAPGGQFPEDDGYGSSFSEKGWNNDDFPMDFSEMENNAKGSEADIPF